MMAEKGHREGTKARSETEEFVDSSDRKSSYFLSETSPASSTSLWNDDQPNGVGDHNDNGFVRTSTNLDVTIEVREPRLEDLEKDGVYDREAILHYLAKLAMSGNGGEFIHDMIRSHFSGFPNSGTKVPNDFSKIEMDGKLTPEDRHYLLVDKLRETLQAVPDSLLHLTTGLARPGDCGRPADQKPDWLDIDKLRRGQKFAQDNMFAVMYIAVIGLIPVYSFDEELKPLIITRKATTPFAAFKRYLSTGLMFRRWYTQDIWQKGTSAWKDMSIARALHLATRKRLEAITNEEIDAATTIPNANCPAREIMMEDFLKVCEPPAEGQCPYIVGHRNPNRPKGINQADMAVTGWSFAALLVSYPQRFGVHHATDEDLEAFCHLWRNIGYQLGMEDEFNFYRGTLEDVRQRSRELVDTWIRPNLREITPEWEHMSRFVHLMETLDMPMPRLYASFSYMDRFVYNLMTGLLHYGMKVPGITSIANAVMNLMLNRAEKYTPGQLDALRIELDG